MSKEKLTLDGDKVTWIGDDFSDEKLKPISDEKLDQQYAEWSLNNLKDKALSVFSPIFFFKSVFRIAEKYHNIK